MNACGNTPPIAIKSTSPPPPPPYTSSPTHPTDKDKWINTERMRWARYFSVPVSATAPPGFPINTLPIQRVLAALSLSHPHVLADAMALFYEHTWVTWSEPLKPENLLALVTRAVGGDEAAAKGVLEATKGAEVKKVLAGNTDQAFKDGAFGLPYFVGELLDAYLPTFCLVGQGARAWFAIGVG
jgi:2-hydroxychromene-2-carboxylate isomerase